MQSANTRTIGWTAASRTGAVAAAQRSVSIGGSASGNVIITGDQNRVGRE